VGFLAYSGGLYVNDAEGTETTGNFVRPGVALEADVGTRVARRYLPYLVYEQGIMGAGHRFDGTSTSASTSFYGIGFRYLAGDVDGVSFASDLSVGMRKFQVSNSGGTWSTSALEIFRLGFGVDIRLSSQVTITPMLTITGGTPSDTSGTVAFAPNQPDLKTAPDFTGDGGIPATNQYSYYSIAIGCGVHADLFGR
jgi:hypothetical protein